MLKFWLYMIVLVLLCALGLTIGSANETVVTFDLLIVKQQMSLAMVMVIGIALGVLVGLYISLLFNIKMWSRASKVKAENSSLKRRINMIKEQREKEKAEAAKEAAAASTSTALVVKEPA